MPGDFLDKLKNTRLYNEIKEIQKQYFEVLGPLSEALYGENGIHGFEENKLPFGVLIQKENGNEDDLTRSGVIYGIAALLAEGMSIDDIFDPNKELERKAEIGKKYLQLVRAIDKKALMEIYIKATERIMDEMPLGAEDNLIDNLRDIKGYTLRKLLFDVNQRFGISDNKPVFQNYFNERYPDKNTAKEQYDKIYNYSDKVHALHHTENKLFEPVVGFKSGTDPLLSLLTCFGSWYQLKDRIKNIQQDTEQIEILTLMTERSLIDPQISDEFNPFSKDLEEFVLQEFNKEKPFENPLEDARVFLYNKYMGDRSPEECAKFIYEKRVRNTVGDLKMDDLVDTNLNHILVNGKPLEFPQNASNAFIEQSLYNQLLEASVAGKKITFFTKNAKTGKYVEHEMKSKIPERVKEALKDRIPKTSISTVPKMKEDDLKKAENQYGANLLETEKMYSIPALRTLMDARYNNNLVANEICKSIFGEENGRTVRYGETLNFMGTGLENQGEINLSENGLAYAVAMLLAEGMSMEDILDIGKETEKKLEAGRRVQELAASGEEGRKELSAMANKAIGIIHKGKFNEVSADILENTSNFHANFAAQIMHVLKNETDIRYNRTYAENFEAVIQLGQNPGTLKSKTPNEWASEYLSSAFFTQTFRELAKHNAYDIQDFEGKGEFFREGMDAYASSSSKMAEALGFEPHDLLMRTGIYENAGLNADLTFQKLCFETLYERLEAVDPGYIRSSAEFRGMKKTLQDILKQFGDTEHAGSKDWYYRLEENCNALTDFNKQYLDLKAGLEPEEGSNAQKRLGFATDAKRFIEAAQTMAKGNGKLFDTIEFYNVRRQMATIEAGIAGNLELYHQIVGASHEVPSSNDPKTDAFLKNNFALKKEENNYKAPDTLNINDEQADLMVMLSVGTVEVSGGNTNTTGEVSPEGTVYNTVNVLGEDIFNRRDRFELDKMQFVEKGRAVVKEAFREYENGNKQKLGKLIAEGLKRYTSTFSLFEYGYVCQDNTAVVSKAVSALKVAADMYDMIRDNHEIQEMLNDPNLGEHKLTQQTIETYRGAKVAYEIYKKSEEAQKDLINMVTSRDKTQYQPQKMKEALAALLLKNIMHKEMVNNYKQKSDALMVYISNKYDNPDNDLQLDDEQKEIQRRQENMELAQKLSMGKNQRGFTLEKMEQRLQKLANSKAVDTMVNKLDTGKLAAILRNEEEFFNSVIDNMMKKEPALVKEKEPKPEKQNVNNELSFIM